MKIIKQTNEQECGVCVLTMLVNKFYLKKISKANVLAKTNLTDKGLNLLDLEKSGSKFGLNIESYECEWNEIFELNKYEPFIILINNEGSNHYAVGILKRKQQLHIYDPIGKKVVLFKSDNNFKFLNIVCLVSKTKTILPTIDFAKPLWSQFYSPHIFWFFFVGVFIFIINLLISFGMSKLFNLIPQNNEILTILMISLILIIMIFINYLARQFEWIIKTWYIKKIYHNSMQHFFKLLKNKSNAFYSLINKANFINFSKYVKEIITYYSDIYVDVAINVIITFSCLLIFSILKWEFLIIFLVNFLLGVSTTLFQINFNKKRIKTMVLKTNELNNNLLFFFDKKLNQNFSLKTNENHLINQLLKVDNHLIYDESFNHKINSINESLQQFFNIIMYFVSWYFFSIDHSFGKIFLIITLFSYCNSSSSSSKFLLNLFISHKSLTYIKEIISFFYNSCNNLNKLSKLLYHPFLLKFKNNFNSNQFIIKFKENEIGNVFDYCYKNLLVNGFSMDEYSQKELNKNVIKIDLTAIDDYAKLEEILYLNDDSKECFLKFISNTQINFNNFEHVKNYNFEIIAILNLFKLTLFSNKLILINNNFGYFGSKNDELLEKLFKKITLNNAVVYLTKFNESTNKVFTEIYDA